MADGRHPGADDDDRAAASLHHPGREGGSEDLRCAEVDRHGHLEVGVAEVRGVDRGADRSVVDEDVDSAVEGGRPGGCKVAQVGRPGGEISGDEDGSHWLGG